MRRRVSIAIAVLLLAGLAFPQDKSKKNAEDQMIRISTQLVQLDVVVTDKKGHVVPGLNKNDFEIYENGKKQQISFFEYVDAIKGTRTVDGAAPSESTRPENINTITGQGPSENDIRRIFAFVVDDLMIRYEDLSYLRQMLANFVDKTMQPTDLVAIVRTVGGKGLLEQFTSDKELLRRAIASITVSGHPLSAFHNPDTERLSAAAASSGAPGDLSGAVALSGDSVDVASPFDETNTTLRSYMSLGVASFLIECMKPLPGRKSMVLISGGLPVLSNNPGTSPGSTSYFINDLADKATRAGVAINTMDIRGLQAYSGVASFDNTPGKSALGGGSSSGFGRVPDNAQFGDKNPFDTMEAHQGLRVLANETGGIPILYKNNFDEGLAQIVGASDGYYLAAYTPTDSNFKNDFRKVEIKVKNKDLKVYNRRGYFAREDRPAAAPVTKQDQVLSAIKAPIARREIDLEAMVLYKAAAPDKGAIDISVVVDPKKLKFEEVNGKQQASYEIDGFVFDELGKLRGGFNDTITASLTADELSRAGQGVGLAYSTTTTLPRGVYQVRLAVRDNGTGNVGTLSRYLEVPDLSKGRLAASSLLLGSAPPGEIKAEAPTPLSASRRISRKQDLRFAVVVYNPKLKDGKPRVQTQTVVSQNGNVIYKSEPEEVAITKAADQVIKIGQLGVGKVKPGRYTLTLLITDTLADKKAQTLTRSMDFVVTD